MQAKQTLAQGSARVADLLQAGSIENQSLPACGVFRKKFSCAEDCAEQSSLE